MSEVKTSRRMRVVAVAAALLAMVFALAAVIVVLARGDDAAQTAKRVGAAPIADRDVHAADVVKLRSDTVEIVIEHGATKGLRVADAELARALGLTETDVITAISGKPMTAERDASDALLGLGLFGPTVLYVEVLRDGTPALLRWRLDGDLQQARHAALDAKYGTGAHGAGSLGGLGTYAPPDPLLDTIEKVDELHYRLPRATVEALLANPTALARGARVVPAIRNGQPDGLKLYGIRPSSLYAKLGFENGDTVRAINGFELTSPDKALEIYTKMRHASSLTFDLWRRGKSVLLDIEITK